VSVCRTICLVIIGTAMKACHAVTSVLGLDPSQHCGSKSAVEQALEMTGKQGKARRDGDQAST
jgi:hypothetical protein